MKLDAGVLSNSGLRRITFVPATKSDAHSPKPGVHLIRLNDPAQVGEGSRPPS